MHLLSLSLLICLSSYSFAKTYFKEEFNDKSWEDRWVQSEHAGKEFGKFKLTAGKFFGDEKINQGIQTSQDARFYAVSSKFDAFSNDDKPLVVQFSVKHEQNIDCGGGYVKVFGKDLDQKDLHGESAYLLMFGPDICGPGTKKVHVIINYKGQNHLIKKNIRCKDDEYTHVYTLIINPDSTYVVKIDNKEEEKGTLEEDWDLLPPKKIKDPNAKKPSQDEWDERETIADEADTKPEDWDKPQHIPDPEAKKPEDWDEEMDGTWEPPNIENPEYKGEWKPKDIPNPAYKGKWIHPEVDNPEYTPDTSLYKLKDIGAIGFDLWQVKSGSIFDNVIITDDIEEAAKHAEDTWGATKDEEKKAKEKQDEEERKKAEEESKKNAADKKDDDEDDDDKKDDDKDEHDHDHDHDHDEL
ncbi:calreticulin-like [Paramacrobiotus metropolitanus]|uniref:calreticulin-like n=1 Tax=Paramacrobiotus metropolitanus TaxID=2943436 RepID=UPI002445E419|nr:calreticulin-like [Paramacrobiotus metropolitanus]